MKRQTNGHTRPRPEEVAQFDCLTLPQLCRLLAAAKLAYAQRTGDDAALKRKDRAKARKAAKRQKRKLEPQPVAG